MKTIDEIRKEYNEVATKREQLLKDAALLYEQMLRLEGQAILVNEPNQDELKKNNKK